MFKTTSASGIALLKQFESCRLKAYKALPTEKYYTIGYGHYGPDVKPGMTITQAEAEAMLQEDLKKYEKPVNDNVTAEITQNMFDALVSFTYNCGADALKKSTLLKKINIKDYTGAAAEFLEWNRSGGKVINGLTDRRQVEASLFLKEYSEYIPTGPITRNSDIKAVKWLQEQLNKANPTYVIPIDGKYTAKTRIAALMYAEMQGWNWENNSGWQIGAGTIKALS
ncbi:lysozyme [Anaerocolumna chitinilytica]|uniref:Lysozyme n=1 Tax=Anaerocolumna chitinilytica TaxID=1727145 RepID=A0A7M3S9X6_9FIRM|nr:lysozyme [Anaerocolumna chitinilytica]BCK01394.1 hypothetical protein bsdcttw_44340 [Anaerocolumna chitinilytica]